MKILHFMLAGIYTDGYTYQENELTIQNAIDGHDVLIIASTRMYHNGNQIINVEPSDTTTKEGIRVIRIPYKYPFPASVSEKLRIYKGVYKIIENFTPDVMLFHGASALELKTAVKYKKAHPKVKLYCDNHAEKANSASGWISKNLLHKGIYAHTLKKCLPYIDKILCISNTCRDFLTEIYGIDPKYLELYPLGGKISDDDKYLSCRTKKRAEFNLSDSQTLVIHSGKLTAAKKTEMLLKAFINTPSENIKLIIIGSIPEEMKPTINPLIEKDSRISFLGWKSGGELAEYLCAGDLYVQPGSQSAVLQNAACLHCAVAVYPHENYLEVLGDTAFYIKSREDIEKLLQSVSGDNNALTKMRIKSFANAREKLDYKKLAQRLYR